MKASKTFGIKFYNKSSVLDVFNVLGYKVRGKTFSEKKIEESQWKATI